MSKTIYERRGLTQAAALLRYRAMTRMFRHHHHHHSHLGVG